MPKQITGIAWAVAAVAIMVAAPARADIATVGYLHEYITEKWSITVDHSDADSNIISLRRLMQTIDNANEKLNGTATTYASDAKYDKPNIASSETTQWAVENLIEKKITGDPVTPNGTFFFRPATSENIYGFKISAKGKFTIDWGDGKIEEKNKTNTEEITYSHEYKLPANNYEIGLSGKATGYTSNSNTGAIEFSASAGQAIKSMRGCLGCIFSTLDKGTNPKFSWAFYKSTELTEIPEGLFQGITGALEYMMFNYTFAGCSGLTSIPADLFGDLSGKIGIYAFSDMFRDCTGLTGNIPEDLFAKFVPPAEYPTGAFKQTFYNCPGLTGPSVKINGKYLYEIWEEGEYSEQTYYNDKKLDDYDSIPWKWK